MEERLRSVSTSVINIISFSSPVFQARFFIPDSRITQTTLLLLHSWPENLKKSKQKNLMKPNKSISIFCNFKNGQKSICELGKKFKTAGNAKKNFDLFDFTSFFCLDFFKFSGPLCPSQLHPIHVDGVTKTEN